MPSPESPAKPIAESLKALDCYLVGGAVRDEILGKPVADQDWVVVGATVQQMLDLGLRPVGQDFPVFINPENGQEYALARTERKTAKGYTGFEFHASPDVTLEDDLARRDLTVNAMAKSFTGEIIDPFNGAQDIRKKLLRHVSPAFVEDPVRILRVARFAARFKFDVAPETKELMQTMVNNGEVDSLVAERVWQEMHKALQTDHPHIFLQVLRECGALARILPEVDTLYGVPQTKTYHPEVDTGIHMEMVMEQVALISPDPMVRFAALVHDLGKGVTPEHILPSHRGHETAGVPLIKELCARLRVPNQYQSLALAVGEYHLHMHKMFTLRPETILKVLEKTRSLSDPQRASQIADACLADARGRTAFETREYPQARLYVETQRAAASVNAGEIAARYEGTEAIKQNIARARSTAIEAARAAFVNENEIMIE